MNPDTARALLTDLACGIPALPRAACRQHRDTFDSVDPGDIDRAEQICSGCAELEPCRRWAEAQPPRSLLGVIAGQVYSYNFRNDKKENQTP